MTGELLSGGRHFLDGDDQKAKNLRLDACCGLLLGFSSSEKEKSAMTRKSCDRKKHYTHFGTKQHLLL